MAERKNRALKKCPVCGEMKPRSTFPKRGPKLLYHGHFCENCTITRALDPRPNQNDGDYIVVYAPDHPLAVRRGSQTERQHRIVFYETHGEGPFTCNWCSDPLTWDNIHVDHFDENKQNNDPCNLVASCHDCNVMRSPRYEKNKTIMRARGRQMSAFGRTQCLNEWARELGITPKAIRLRLTHGWPLEQALSLRRQTSE